MASVKKSKGSGKTGSNQKTPAERITVMVDGRPVEVPRTTPDPIHGRPLPTTMIQACAEAKVDVPHYCYHPKLPVAGNCRMCLVQFGTPALGPDRQPVMNPDGTPQIRKSPRPAIACATPVSPGMEIYTDTPEVKEMREGVLEFLLINHPLDCPICDQAGECKLQEYSLDHGQAKSRFAETKVHKPKQVDLGPRIMLDDERCILCSRCIRFTKDVAGDDALGFINRGSYSTLTAYPGRAFDNNYTLNTVDICPVGALTSKDFRFKMRVWFLKEAKSLCTSCGTGCNIVIGSREGKIFRYEPRENDAVNACWMCDAGRLNYKWIGHPDRLDTVKVKSPAGRIEDSHWSLVMGQWVELLQKAEPGSVAIVASSRQTNEELYLLKILADALKAVTETVPRQGEGDALLVDADKNPNSLGARLTGITTKRPGYRLKAMGQEIEEGKIRTLLVFGEDVTRVGWDDAALDKLDHLIVSDILPNATTARADLLLPGCAHAEKRGTFTNVKGRVQRFWKAVEGPGDARAEWEFLVDLVGRVTGTPQPDTLEGLFNEMAAKVPAFAGLTWAGLGDGGADVEF